jgi:hypothetical protein
MPDPNLPPDPFELRRRALSRWDNEGGALAAEVHEADADAFNMTNAELVLLRVRVIALENLLIAVLAEGSDALRQAARDMADMISTRPGFTPHPLTIRAAPHMTDLVERAIQVRAMQP